MCRVQRAPRFPDKAELADYREQPGGQIATAVLGCARLGLRAAFVGSVGDDAAGAAALEPLRRAGVDLSGVKRVAGATTRHAVILVDASSGERAVLWQRDARLALRPGDLDAAAIRSARALLVDAEDPEASSWAAQVARQAGVPVVLDADRPVEGLEKLLSAVDFPIVSREFAESVWGGGSPREALRRLAGPHVRLAVVTLGPEGALAAAPGRVLESPGFPVEARDTTGAGDAFRSGFVWGLLAGADAERVLRAANASAALNCRAEGAQAALPTRDELEALMSRATEE